MLACLKTKRILVAETDNFEKNEKKTNEKKEKNEMILNMAETDKVFFKEQYDFQHGRDGH